MSLEELWNKLSHIYSISSAKLLKIYLTSKFCVQFMAFCAAYIMSSLHFAKFL